MKAWSKIEGQDRIRCDMDVLNVPSCVEIKIFENKRSSYIVRIRIYIYFN